MLEDSAFEHHTVLQTLRNEPWEVDSRVDAHRGKRGGGVDPRPEGSLGERAELDIGLNESRRSLVGRSEVLLLTFGTTSLNQGLGESSSEDQSAVVDPASFDLLCISHSVQGRSVHRTGRENDDAAYLGNERRPLGGFERGPPAEPKCSYPIQPPLSHEQTLYGGYRDQQARNRRRASRGGAYGI